MRDRLAAVWRLLRTEHGWSRVWVSLGMAITMAGGGLIYYQTTQGGGDCTYPSMDVSCFPDASNTGVPGGTTLTDYTGPSLISVDDTVIDSKDITTCLVIDDNTTGVIIRKSHLHGAACTWAVDALQSGISVTIEDSEIECNNQGDAGLAGNHMTVQRNDIHDCADGIKTQDFNTIKDNYIHDLLGPPPDPHMDGIQASHGSETLIQHNTILARDTSAIFIENFDEYPTVENLTITENLMGAQTELSVSYVMYCNSVGTSININVTNNSFKDLYPPVGGNFYPNCVQEGWTFSGNIVFETGASKSP